MGDRGNIAITQFDGSHVYLYTHWSGSEIGSTLQRALRKNWRWDDEAYLARIIFEEMIKGQEGTETGFGISTMEVDKNHPTLFVNCRLKNILVGPKSWSFEDFIKIENVDEVINGY